MDPTLNFGGYHFKHHRTSIMSFLVKEPCVRARNGEVVQTVLYEILYNPDRHPDVFADCLSTCNWLVELLSTDGLICTVTFFDEEFLVQPQQSQCLVAVGMSEVASAGFHPLDVKGLIARSFERDPFWMGHSDAHFLSAFYEHGRRGLIMMAALDLIQCRYGQRASLADLSRCLLQCLKDKIALVSSLQTVDLRVLVGETSMSASRSLLAFRYFSCCFGVDLMRLLMVPEHRLADQSSLKDRVEVKVLTTDQQTYRVSGQPAPVS